MAERLHELVCAYKASGQGLEAIFSRIAADIYREPRRYGFDSEDDVAEAFERYRERIRGFPARYVDKGVPFDAYLTVSLRFIARSMRRLRRQSLERDIVCERAERWNVETGEHVMTPCQDLSATYDSREVEELFVRLGLGKGEAGAIRAEAFRSRLVYLYLKCAWSADDEDTLRVASIAGVQADWLAAVVAQARRYLEHERERYERCCLARDRSWSRPRLLEARLCDEVEPARRERLTAKIGRERARYAAARAKFSNMRPLVPNAVVARILGVPKGTVDSGIYYLKRLKMATA